MIIKLDGWNTYPRPGMVRASFINLNGEWCFEETGKEMPESYSEKINVPYCMESELSGVNRRHFNRKYMWYERKFDFSYEKNCAHVLLHCGGIDRKASVWINGIRMPQNIDFLNECIELFGLKEGENTITVRVYDNLKDQSVPYGKQSTRPSGMWYTPVSGIWQTIWIEQVPKQYVREIKVVQAKNGVDLKFYGIRDGIVTLDSGEKYRVHDGSCRIRFKNAGLWSPEKPKLYHYTLLAGEDSIASYFGIRSNQVREVAGIQRLCLNEKPVFYHGLLDQGYFPDGIYTPKNPEEYLTDIERAKNLGFNMLRKHIKVEPQIFYYLCDVYGIAVFQDMVNNSDYSFLRDTIFPTFGFQWLPDYNLHKDMHQRIMFYKYAKETVKRLYNHPSIVYWTIFNEGWGQFHSSKMYEIFKKWDPDRFVDSASGWFSCGKTDVSSWHVYFHRFLFTKHLRPVVLSEFGGYAMKISGHTFDEKRMYGYNIFSDKAEYSRALLKLYDRDVIRHIENGLSADVYTQLTDVETEENGLYTYDREVCKVECAIMKLISERIKEEMVKVCQKID